MPGIHPPIPPFLKVGRGGGQIFLLHKRAGVNVSVVFVALYLASVGGVGRGGMALPPTPMPPDDVPLAHDLAHVHLENK